MADTVVGGRHATTIVFGGCKSSPFHTEIARRLPPMGLYMAHSSSYEHDTGAHPENAGRLRAIEATLDNAGWPGLRRIEAPAATREQLGCVHSATHIDGIEEFCANGGGMIDVDTVTSEGSFEAALHAAGGAVDAVERLLAGDDSFAFCGLRPPGHHAETARAMGFCLFNNVAVAAAHALAESDVRRVLVLDWDVHHGNGTEAIFAASDRVLYASIHQWPLYPGTGAAAYSGEGDGEGYTVNLPVPPGSGSDVFLSLVQHVVVPIARSFGPGLIAISAGYDAHRDDPLADCEVQTEAYGEMAATMRGLSMDLGAPVLVCLEGGYDPTALGNSVLATIEALEHASEVREAPLEPAQPYIERQRERWPDF
jgi:acetoin utilization deacetylase AcuC-like enzyme